MLTRAQILQAVRSGKAPKAMDERDFGRLAKFFHESDLPTFGRTLREGATWSPTAYTEENILEQLRQDVEFGFEKALDKRGISAHAMYACVKLWMWVLEDHELEDEEADDYDHYGLPFLKAVAVKYGLPNAIGDHTGSEPHYSE